jgi:hypothetical protein
VPITADQSIFHQQNNATRVIALIQLSTPSWKRVRSAHALILAAVERATPGSFERVEIPAVSTEKDND